MSNKKTINFSIKEFLKVIGKSFLILKINNFILFKILKYLTNTLSRKIFSKYHAFLYLPQFFKRVVCKHIIGVSIRLGLTQAPLEAKSVPLGQKRKRGRPSKEKPALVRQ